jgi:hypothetical protein
MAFTSQEKTKILYYLGYSVFEDDGPAMRAIHSLDSKESVGGFIIRGILDKLDVIEEQIQQTIPLAKAIRDGSIEIRVHMTLDHLWRLGRSQVNRLARFTKVSIGGDIFSSRSNSSDPGSFYSGDPSENRIDPDSGVPTR